ncbi:MAG: hypothetical protein HC922_04395 [Leptolyngbyaceae cyanobacterium SM2_3_12]|nr:hypothetical protein [Leptolyngbyaceae cyanobacterium SM2_3_12]
MSRLSRQVQPAETYLAKLTEADWATLMKREVLLKGSKGQYGVMVATPVDAGIAWAVLTDYDNFYRFLPSVAESRVVEKEGDRTVVEQLDRRRILLSTMESLVRTENLEIDRQQISFRLLEGNLEYMYGHWRIDPSPSDRGDLNLLLVSRAGKGRGRCWPL